jgi:galactoside O-acetyltransferase
MFESGNSFYSQEELSKIPFLRTGKNVLISRKCSIYSADKISVENNVRIDDYCILSGQIEIGSFVHISAYTALYGKYGITINDYVTISGRVLIYSQSDDYSGYNMTNPLIHEEFTNISGGRVVCNKFSIIGSGSIILPGVNIGEGAAIGAMSLVKKSIPPWTIYKGIPARYYKDRQRRIILLEKEFRKKLKS